MAFTVALAADGDVLAECHGHGSTDGGGKARHEDRPRIRGGPGDADDDGRGGHDAVVRAEHSRAQGVEPLGEPSAADLAVAGALCRVWTFVELDGPLHCCAVSFLPSSAQSTLPKFLRWPHRTKATKPRETYS